MQRKCHCCNTLFQVKHNETVCECCSNPETRKAFIPPKDELTWRQKFDIKWAKYDEEHEHKKLNGKRSMSATHCCVCGARLPPVEERKYGRFCSSKCKRSQDGM